MSLENSKDALDHGLYLSEVEDKFKREYEDYLLDQLVFFIGVLRQESTVVEEHVEMLEDVSTRSTIRNIIKLLGG